MVTMTTSIYNGDHHGNMITVDPVRPIPHKCMHSIAMVSISIVTIFVVQL